MEQKPLTVNQEKFAQEFVLTGNASEAYRRAYPNSLKWKDDSVNNKASAMLRHAQVLARVNELRAEVKEKFDISAERLLLEQSRLALFDFRRLWDENGRLIDPTNMPDDVAAAVSSVKVKNRTLLKGEKKGEVIEQTILELKLWNKNAAIESLMKHKGLYEKDNAQKPVVIINALPPQIPDMITPDE